MEPKQRMNITRLNAPLAMVLVMAALPTPPAAAKTTGPLPVRPPAGPVAAAAGPAILDPSSDPAAVTLTLADALAGAARANPDLVAARSARDIAAAGVRSANVAPNPVLQVGTSQYKPGGFGGQSAWDLSFKTVNITQTIEMGGKRSLRVGAAKAGLAAAGLDVADTARTTSAMVTSAFFHLKAAQDRLALARSVAANYSDSLAVAERRVAAGDLSQGELARQRVEALRAASDASAAKSGLEQARLDLALMIGRETDAPHLFAAGDWPKAAPNAADPSALAEARPDVAAARARVEQARKNLMGAQRLRVPDVSVSAELESQGTPFGIGNTAGLTLAVPLMIGNRYGGTIDAARAALTQAEVTATRLAAQATAQIVAARALAVEARGRRQQYEQDLLPSARAAAATAEFAWSRGAISLTDLLDARRALASAELGAIGAREDEAAALAALRAAEQGSEPNPVMQDN